MEFAANKDINWENEDFSVGYKVWGEAIVASCNIQEPLETSFDPRGTFCVSVAPPEPDAIPRIFSRSVVFVIDRSGSMTGDPMDYAKKALQGGVHSLQPYDDFTIIAFDHE